MGCYDREWWSVGNLVLCELWGFVFEEVDLRWRKSKLWYVRIYRFFRMYVEISDDGGKVVFLNRINMVLGNDYYVVGF